MEEDSFKKLVQTLQCQFLSCYPVYNIQWENISQKLTWEQQELLLKNTCDHKLNKLQPIKLDYQLNFLKRLIQILEQNCEGEVHDDIYNEYCKLQQLSSQASSSENSGVEEYVFKHYLLPEFGIQLTLREAKTFVGRGTTGLCTWQASLALTDYLLHHKHYVEHKKILELGAGTGLCGMILMRCDLPKVMALTDGSLECIELMQHNFKLNFPQAQETDFGFLKLNDSEKYLGAFHLSWEDVKDFEFNNEKLLPNLILAADVIYDDSLFADFIKTIDFIFEKTENKTKMLLAATVRNEETLEEFLEMVPKTFTVKECDITPENERFIQWDRTSIVRILEITKKF